MTDLVDGGAPAPAENTAAPAAPVEPIAHTPEPIKTEPQAEPAKAEAEKPPSNREALRRAAEKIEAREKAEPAKTEKTPDAKAEPAKPVKDEGPQRDDTGRFAPKEGAKPQEAAAQPQTSPGGQKTATAPADSLHEAPERFSADAKAAWAATPDHVKAETARAVREMTAGIEKYRPDAEAFGAVKEFAERAKAGGTDLKTALTHYVGIEDRLRANPIQGMEEICSNVGLSLRQVAEHVLGRTPDQAAAATDSQIREARGQAQHFAGLAERQAQEIADLRGQLDGLIQERIDGIRKAEPRFDELRPVAARILNAGLAGDLSEALEMAKQWKPAASPSGAAPIPSAAPAVAAVDPQAQTLKGSKSIAGAPTPGSDPVSRAPARSNREALERAVARVG